MERYYLTPIIGSGKDLDSFRPKISMYECDWSAYKTIDPQKVLVAVKAPIKVFTQIEIDTDIQPYTPKEDDILPVVV